MRPPSGCRRRAFLASACAAAAGVSGCIGRSENSDGDDSTPETAAGGTPRATEPTTTPRSTDTPSRTGSEPAPRSTDAFVSGEGGYPTYRIPALVRTEAGTLLAFCEARQGGDRGPTDTVVKRSTDGGRTWGDQRVVHSEGDLTVGNPTPVVDRSTGTVHLPLVREYRDVLMTRSTDDGRTWSEPTEITGSVKRDDWGYYATGPGVGIQLERGEHAGRLLIPATHWTYLWERGQELPDDNLRYDHAFYSDDGGETWQLGGTVGPHVDEPQAVELPDGRVTFNMRNYREASDGRAVATSDDGGDSWSEIGFDETLVTPRCQASTLRYSWPESGRSRILFANPAHEEQRVDLTVRLSYDEGESWSHSKRLHDGPSAYSCLSILPDGSVGCLFERGSAGTGPYRRLAFHRFTIEWLTDGADAPR